MALPAAGLSALLVASLSVASIGQERRGSSEDHDGRETSADDLRQLRVDERREALFDPLPSGAAAPPLEAPALRSTGLLPAALAPAIFPPRYHRVGDFALSGITTVGATYDDNIEADDADREDSTILGASVSGRAQSLFTRHSLGFSATASGSYYVDENENSDLAWVVGTDGRIDLSRRSNITAAAQYTQGSEDPESLDRDDDADETAEFWSSSAEAAFNRQHERFSWSAGGGVSHSDFDGVESNERDLTSYAAFTQLRYERFDRLGLRTSLRYRLNRFPNESADRPSRDSDRVTVLVGADYEVGPRTSVGGSIGYTQILFDDPGRDDDGSVVGDVSLSYTPPSRDTRVSFGFNHSASTTTAGDASTRQTTRARVTVTRLLGRSTALSGRIGYTHAGFDQEEPSSDTISFQVGLGHAFNSTFGAGVGYRFSQRFSGDDDDEFYRNLFTVGVTANF